MGTAKEDTEGPGPAGVQATEHMGTNPDMNPEV